MLTLDIYSLFFVLNPDYTIILVCLKSSLDICEIDILFFFLVDNDTLLLLLLLVLSSDNRVLSNCVTIYMCRPRLIDRAV